MSTGGASGPLCASSVGDHNCDDQGRGFGRDMLTVWAKFLGIDTAVAGVNMAE